MKQANMLTVSLTRSFLEVVIAFEVIGVVSKAFGQEAARFQWSLRLLN